MSLLWDEPVGTHPQLGLLWLAAGKQAAYSWGQVMAVVRVHRRMGVYLRKW